MIKTSADAAGFGARHAASGGWKPRGRARSVGEFVPALMRPAFEKYGFSAATILTEWAALVGPDLAACSAPERLKWPRLDTRETSGSHRQGGATLILRVSGARALEIEHRRPQIIERLNASFGYRAVADIRIVQAPLERRAAPRRTQAPPSQGAGGQPHDFGIRDGRLQAALARLSAGIKMAGERA